MEPGDDSCHPRRVLSYCPTNTSQSAEMRAYDVLNALERLALFRAQAADSHRRVEDIGDDLDSAISLLDLRQSREEAVVGER